MVKEIINYVNKESEGKRKIELVNVSGQSGFFKGFGVDVLRRFGVEGGEVEVDGEIESKREREEFGECLRAYPFSKDHDGFFVALFKINYEE